MISFSLTSDAEPRSHTLSVDLLSLTCRQEATCTQSADEALREEAEHEHVSPAPHAAFPEKSKQEGRGRTRMLSGLRSACMISHLRMSDRARNIWLAYARTARKLRPTSLP